MSKITLVVDLDDLQSEVDETFSHSLAMEFDNKLRQQVREKCDELVKTTYNQIGSAVKENFDKCLAEAIEKYCQDKLQWVDTFTGSKIKDIINETVSNNKYLIESNMREVIKSYMKEPMADYLKNKAVSDLDRIF